MLDQVSLKLIVALKNMKEIQQRCQINMGNSKQRQKLLNLKSELQNDHQQIDFNQIACKEFDNPKLEQD